MVVVLVYRNSTNRDEEIEESEQKTLLQDQEKSVD